MASMRISTVATIASTPRQGGISGGRVVAVLGPTNTGKTHFAIERMIGHATGVIGLPLRLLAREVYDRIATIKGRASVALITGEEKIVPAHPNWFVCTVESMPLDREFDFVGIDEIQLAADAERGHVFTDRLLRARGRHETMFVGAETIRPLIRRLAPEAEFITRPRFSALNYAGPKKLSRLAPRTAVIAFSANEVYAVAEAIRSRRGGAAVVMGALSPRTRNAQVALYQSGEVDYLVATDAIGMGLNMEIDHVAFAGLRKFDGHAARALSAAEIGQIAGRAGRYLNPGSFGLTDDAGALSPQIIERVENHRFDALTVLRWRNSDLDYATINTLVGSLEARPPADCLTRGRNGVDYLTLRALATDPEIRRRASSKARVGLLWQVCRVPDFRQVMLDSHVQMAAKLFRHLTGPDEVLPADWMARQMSALDRVDGDIDALSTRIAFIRTWTYVSHRTDWLRDAAHWQGRAREIEDRLSDALHQRLTQRFVDHRQSVLNRRVLGRAGAATVVEPCGEVQIDGMAVGRLQGLRFTHDAGGPDSNGGLAGGGIAGGGIAERNWRSYANRALIQAVEARSAEIAGSPDGDFTLSDDALINWRGQGVARLVPGVDVLTPRLKLLDGNELCPASRTAAQTRLGAWLNQHRNACLGALMRVQGAEQAGPAAGLAFQLVEELGAVPRQQVNDLVGAMDRASRHRLSQLGVQFGEAWIYAPATFKRAALRLKSILWALHQGKTAPSSIAAAQRVVQEAAPHPDAAWAMAGFAVIAGQAVPIEKLERLAHLARRISTNGQFELNAEALQTLGGPPLDGPPLDGLATLAISALQSLGYSHLNGTFRRQRYARTKDGGPHRRDRAMAKTTNAMNADLPFARLKELVAH
jgi:ATP-dependent RNA helicase SUPV3L1/SUV3